MSDTCDKADKRQKLLEVAESLFAKHGFEAVSVRQLAAEADVNLSMVSYYFGSKDGLFQELIKSKFPQTRSVLEDLAQSDIHPWEKLTITIDMYVDKFFLGRAFHRVIMREMSLQQRPEHVNLIREHMARSQELIRGFIHEGQKKGLFKYVDVELTIATLFGTLSSAINQGALTCSMLKETNLEALYSDQNRERYKQHLKALLHAHLMTAGV
jgi:AcrR family transcriptional regulator